MPDDMELTELTESSESGGARTVRELEAVYDIPVTVSAVLGKTTMQVSQLLKLYTDSMKPTCCGGIPFEAADFPDAVASHPISETGGCDGGSSEGGRTTHWGDGVGRASVDRPFADRAGEPRGARPDAAALSG